MFGVPGDPNNHRGQEKIPHVNTLRNICILPGVNAVSALLLKGKMPVEYKLKRKF